MSPVPLRVAHIVLSLDTGGLERVVFDLVRLADRGRIEPGVVCLRGAGAMAPLFREAGVPVTVLETRGRWDAVIRLARRLRALRPDVVHTHNPTPHLVGAIAARLAAVPVVVHTRHGRNYPNLRRAVLASRVASALTDAVVAVSADAAAVARDVDSVRGERIRVLHNGIDLERFRPVRRPPRTPRRAIHVARLNAVKDQPTLLRAARLVADARADFQLLIVGDGPERPRLESLAAELGLTGHVEFLGFRSEVAALLGEADVFVLSSLSEGVSLTLLEAMAAGLPVVATDVGGNREVVLEGETGRLVAPRSPEALAGALLSVLGDAAGAQRMGMAARHRAEAHFDVRRTAAAYERLYEELRARHARRAA